MPLSIFPWLYLFFAVPQPVVNWANSAHDSIKIVAEGKEELLDRCLQSGIEVRYRFEMKYCVAGKYWFDDCEEEWVEINSLKYDPVKETYQVRSDRLRDSDTPVNIDINSKSEALARLSSINNISIDVISHGKLKQNTNKNYIGIKVISDCKGSLGSTMLDIAFYATFGLVKISRFDSGWVAFYLNN